MLIEKQFKKYIIKVGMAHQKLIYFFIQIFQINSNLFTKSKISFKFLPSLLSLFSTKKIKLFFYLIKFTLFFLFTMSYGYF
jgi:hypothetical protein